MNKQSNKRTELQKNVITKQNAIEKNVFGQTKFLNEWDQKTHSHTGKRKKNQAN